LQVAQLFAEDVVMIGVVAKVAKVGDGGDAATAAADAAADGPFRFLDPS